jgi:hypothetical protein
VRFQNIALAAIVPLFLLSYSANAQWIGQIQTEFDWDNLFNQGFFDFTSYQIYRDLTEGESVKDTLEYIQAALGNNPTDLIAPLGNAGAMRPQPGILPRHGYLRSGQKVQAGQNSGYVLLSTSYQGLALEFKGRNDNSAWQTERRSIRLTNDTYNVTIGNYSADIGLGLGIGRYEYRPINMPKDSIESDFLNPDNSYYNGAKVEIDNRYTFLMSSKKYLSVRQDFGGGSLSIPVGDNKIGLTASATGLVSNGKHRTLGESSIFYSNSVLGISSELGYAESGAGFVCDFDRRNYDIKFWYYDDTFINPQSSGMAYPDYITFRDERFPVTFRQPQAGESGLSFRKTMTLNRLQLVGWSSLWKRSPQSTASLDNSLGARLAFGDGFDINGRYAERFGQLTGRTLTELGLSFRNGFEAAVLASVWFDDNASDNSRSFAHLYLSVPIKPGLVASARIRSHFDGNLEYFIEERTTLADRLTLKATYRWQDSFESENGPLYLILETSY